MSADAMKRALQGVVLTAVLVFPGRAPSVHAGLFSQEKNVEQIKEKLEKLPESGREARRAVLLSELATLLYKEGDFEEAGEYYEKALQYPTSRRMRRHIYRFLGKIYEANPPLDRAIYAYEKAAEYDPKNWRRHRDLGQLYERVKLYRKAEGSYLKALERNPKRSLLYYRLGRVYRRENLFDEAVASFAKARELGMKPSELALEFSLAYEGQGRYQDAAVAFEKGLTEESAPRHWARFVFLSVVANNKAFANEGMNQLRKKDISEETLRFYETLVLLMGKSFEKIYQTAQVEPAAETILKLIESRPVQK